MEAQLAENVPTYEPPEDTVNVNFVVPVKTREALEAVVKLWVLLAKSRNESPKVISAVNMSHVARRLLRLGAEQAFAEVGLDLERVLTGEVEWSTVEKSILSSAKKR